MTHPVTHKVVSGDTLFSLAKKYGLTVNELKSINNLTSDKIKIGQVLKLTSTVNVSVPYTTVFEMPMIHKVVSGDTLTSIAKKYSTTVQNLKSLNELSSDVIKLGQILKLQPETIVKPVNDKRAIVFFIGGAGDKESFYGAGPYENIVAVHADFTNRVNQELFEFFKQRIIFDRKRCYLGYNEIHGYSDIQKNVIDVIKNQDIDFIYIIGHSLGGWNGAQLTTELKKQGYFVEMLITLDPVGEGIIVSNFSDIGYKQPIVTAKTWINIRCEPDVKDSSDKVADFGEQWKPTVGMTHNVITKVHHADALGIMKSIVVSNQTAMDLLLTSIRNNLR